MQDLTEQKIVNIKIEDEMKKSFIDYAMSVIVSRALPDVKDGLKPVHRRILYSMYELGLTPEKGFRKSARIVGDVLGKYHPHGDTSVYDAMVRLAQEFSTRYLLVNGHGNFGSVDGDSAAAMRYTEAKMSKLTTEMLADINKNTIDFRANFDETLKEPVVLPSRFPNLLVNGSSGIAVGMATNIPPHNMGEVIDGTIALIDHPEMNIDDLMQYIKGPDFPTGGIIQGMSGIKQAYHTGRGRVITRAKTSIEQLSNNKARIIVTEIPYMVNKVRLIEKIAELVRDKKIDGISNINDESDRRGMRIVIETKRDANPNIILNYLYKHTQLQDTFGVIMLALVDGEPRVMDLKTVLTHYINHQQDVVTRRTKYELNKAEARAHILEGLLIALHHIDDVIEIIKQSQTVQEARQNLMERFKLSEKQSQAILDMRLQRLTGLEIEKIQAEYDELQKKIASLKEILSNDQLLNNIIKDELTIIRNKYIDERRTEITFNYGEIDVEDLIEEHDIVVTLTHFGYIKRLPADTYKSQNRGGRGITGLNVREEDFIENIFVTSTHQTLLFFSSFGKVYSLKGYQIPEAGRQARGTAIINILQLDPNETIKTVIPVIETEEEQYLMIGTRNGYVKKTPLVEYTNIRKTGLNAITIREDDEVVDVQLTCANCDIIMASHQGYSIRFNESDARPMGRTAMGVRGMKLRENDYIINMEVIDEASDVVVISEKGYGKRTANSEYRSQTRGGKGIITMNTTEKTGNLVAMKIVNDEHELMIINSEGIIIRTAVEGISRVGRNTQGVKVMRVDDTTHIVSVACTTKSEEQEDIETIDEDDE